MRTPIERRRLRNAIAGAMLGALAQLSSAQSPALNTDAWVQFPPRPRPAPLPVELAPPAPSTPAVAPEAPERKRVKPKSQATPKETPAPVANTPPVLLRPESPLPQAPADNWVRFPVLPSRPNTAVAPTTTAAPAAPIPPALATPAPTPPGPAPFAAAAPKVRHIVDFTVTGNERIASDEILALVSHQRGQPLSNDTLRQVTDAVSDLYQSKGILALVEMPAQDLTLGVPQIKVTEARFAGVVLEDPKGQLANRPRLPADLVEHHLPKGELVSLPALDSASAALADVPGVHLKVSLRPGEKPGETQAVVMAEPGKAVDAVVSVDNAGSKATGEWRESARVTLNNPLKLGDIASVQQLHSSGLDFMRGSYSVPVGAAGWRVGVNASVSRYKVIQPEFQALNVRGPASTTGVDLSIPLLRSNQDAVTLLLGADQRRYRNEALDVVQSDYKGSTVSATLEGTHRNGMQSETSASLQWVSGKIDLAGSPTVHQLNDAATVQTQGDYGKARLNLMHREDLDPFNTVLVSAQGQWASKNLDGSEKFFLGGANGVRAYPTNEGGGSLGHLISLEWQRHFNWKERRLTTAAFYDAGQVTVNKHNAFNGASETNRYGLSGAGFWVGTAIPNRYGLTTVRFTAAHRLGTHAGANPVTGMDQDGTRVLNRYRVSLTQTF